MNTPKKIMLFSLLTLLVNLASMPHEALAQPGSSVSLQVFYDQLAPYGRWIERRGYGRVWIPRVESDFQPYGTRGHWVVTEYGNTWVSDYDWGWAPFHYGRWMMDDLYGWIWVPDTDWGPAWVSWRSGGGYYGWAPLTPGIDVSVHIDLPLLRWIFVPERYICSPAVYSYRLPRQRVVNVYHSTTIINNIYVNNNRRYFYGPRPQELERATRSRVVVRRLDFYDRPGRMTVNNESVRAYRPEMRDSRYDSRHRYNYTLPSEDRRRDWNESADRERNGAYRPGRSGNRSADEAAGEGWRNSRPSRPSRNEQNSSSPQRPEQPSGESVTEQNRGQGRGERWSRPERNESERPQRIMPEQKERPRQYRDRARPQPSRGARTFAG